MCVSPRASPLKTDHVMQVAAELQLKHGEMTQNWGSFGCFLTWGAPLASKLMVIFGESNGLGYCYFGELASLGHSHIGYKNGRMKKSGHNQQRRTLFTNNNTGAVSNFIDRVRNTWATDNFVGRSTVLVQWWKSICYYGTFPVGQYK